MENKITLFAKILISLALGVTLFLGFRYFLDHKKVSSDTSEKVITPEIKVPQTSQFSFVPPEPINGTLKGVVELGASGFNSFIVRIDKSKNWKLEKSDFGNSLVLENMASETDIREGLKAYIGSMLDYGVTGNQIHFVVSSGASKSDVTQKIIKSLKAINYFVNTVTPEQEGSLALNCVLPKDYEEEAFVVDMGSSNTKVSWKNNKGINGFETFGSKYFQDKADDGVVYNSVKEKIKSVPSFNRKTCFIIGGVPYKLAKQVRTDKERYTILLAPNSYKLDDAKEKAGLNIYKAIKDETGCKQFVFDWDANFTIGYLLGLP
jgi:hypothetical protein